jgi:nucleoside phosphorylase
MALNSAHLPGDFTILDRVERIEGRLERIHAGTGTLTDALVIVRTQEAFADGFILPPEDLQEITAALCHWESASGSDVRTASLVRLDTIPEHSAVEAALTRWVERYLPEQSTDDALWILEKQAGDTHAAWWRQAVGRGVRAACRAKTGNWATAIWRWWEARPDSVPLTTGHLEEAHETEAWLASSAPSKINDALLDVLAEFCREREWPTLLGRALGSGRPLATCVERLRQCLSHPEAALDGLLVDRENAEIVDAAAAMCWPPLVVRAASLTLTNPRLLVRALGSSGLVPLLLRHLSQGGAFPVELVQRDFLMGIFDSALEGDEGALKIVRHLDGRAGRFVLDHPKSEQLLQRIGGDVEQGVIGEWWRRFLADDSVGRPPSALCAHVISSASTHISGTPITLVMRLLQLFPEIAEARFEAWMNDIGFRWESGDHQRLADLLVERKWKVAAKALRWSWKSELKLVAWHARDLLSWYERFLNPPQGAEQTTSASKSNLGGDMKIIDVGIITMKEEEFDALLEKLAPTETVAGANRDYDMAAINTERGVCRVAITRCAQQGNAHAQNTATELLSDLSAPFVLVVGIAGGIPTPDFCLGDVVVSDYIQDLTYEDTGTASGDGRFNALGGPLHPSATRIVERLRAVERGAGPWNEADKIGVPRPTLAGRHTTNDAQWNADITDALQRHAGRSAPIATAKKIASSDRLIKDPELLKKWRTVLKGVAAVEMESAGVYIPCQRGGVPVLAIRGISDIVGWKRDEAWTRYACHAAAAYVRMLIDAGVFCSREDPGQ